MDGRHHLAADRVEDGQRGERPGDFPVLRHVAHLFGGFLDGAVVDQLDARRGPNSTHNSPLLLSNSCIRPIFI